MKKLFNLPFWKSAQDYGYILIGSFIQALSLRLFLIPTLLTSGGITGLAQISYHFWNWPVGLVTLLGNLPLFILGWRFLGGRRFAVRTLITLITFSLFADLLVFFIPANGITKDLILGAVYGGVLLGLGLGLVYRGRGTSGGTDIICRMMNRHLNIPISQAFLIADGFVVVASGLAFGWDRALYGLVVIYISGLTAERISEGSAIFRDAMIISDNGKLISERIQDNLGRGVTILPGTGSYTRQSRPVLYCVITRSEVHRLKLLVYEVDPHAFMVIGQAHEVLGEGFLSLDD
ncbi:MAG: YitT family protein [Anaerolineaceae bacterium]|nr:YitT family protein [Anaerolineaceae bacterium]